MFKPLLDSNRRPSITQDFIDRFRGVVLTCVICMNIGLLLADFFAPGVYVILDPNRLRAEEGHAYIFAAPVRHKIIFEVRGDSVSEPGVSSLQLLEDGKKLGPAHTSHARIRTKGHGAYAHWESQIYFSTSDNSDPRTNGRTYVAQITTSVNNALHIMGFILLASVALVFYRERMLWWTTVGVYPAALGSTATISGLMIASVAAAVGLVVYGWYEGPSIGFTVANFFPISDAGLYHACATSLAATGHFDHATWCSRRALYPSLLATLLLAAGWHGEVALLLQAALIGLAIMIVGLESARLLGWISGALAVAALFVFAREFALSAFVTEVAGLSVGLIGVALLLRYVRCQSTYLLIAGLALISVALTARAGAMLLLPALMAWGWLMIYRSGYHTGRSVVIILAIATGPLLQLGMLLALNIDPRNTGANFAASLYGLSTGSRDWSQAYRDFDYLTKTNEAAAFRHIYGVALSNIFETPGVFIKALLGAGRLFVTSLFRFGSISKMNIALSLLLLAGILTCCHRWRTPLGSLLLVMAASEAMSAPFVIDSGGQRVFAASIAVRVLLAALGLRVILSAVWRRPTPSSPHGDRSRFLYRDRSILEFVLGSLIVFAIVLPVTPLGRLFRLERLPGLGCPAHLTEVVTRLDRESLAIGIVDPSYSKSVIPYRVTRERLQSDIALKNYWWGPDFLTLPAGSLVIRAFQRLDNEFATTKHVLWSGLLPSPDQYPVSLCLDATRSTTLGDVSYLHVASITALPR